MNDGNDIKRLLGRAFGPEPPLTLDREEVFRRGQRRVRARRLAASGGVAASVMAVVVGAAALTGLNDPSPNPAAEASPRPPALTTTISPSPSSSPPPTTPLSSVAQADLLTTALADAKLIPAGIEVREAGYKQLPPLTFHLELDKYQAEAKLLDSRGAGMLFIDIKDTKGALPPTACPADPRPSETCRIVADHGYPMALVTDKGRTGEVVYYANAVRPDGTELSAMSNNLASVSREEVTRDTPPLDFDVLMKIVALPGLSVR